MEQTLARIREDVLETAERTAFRKTSPPELEEAIGAYFSRSGKLIRPALCLLTAEALGGRAAYERALPVALATELFHLFSLLQDDVIDHDELRRGAPAAHVLAARASGLSRPDDATEYGRAVAILAGDALLGRAVALLSRAPLSESARLLLIQTLTDETLPDLLSGEALDTKLGYQSELADEADLSRVYSDKTGALFSFAVFAGAVCATDGVPARALCDAADAACRAIGEAFQLADDRLGLTADEATLGKPVLSDIREGKQTFFVLETLRSASEDERALLMRTLGHRGAPQKDVLAVRDLLLCRTEKFYRARLSALREDCRAFFDLLEDCEAKTALAELFSRMVCREH